MSKEPKHEQQPSPPDQGNDRPVSSSRRRLVLITAPVILGVANRPAWANVCSISGMYSGPISGIPDTPCQGLTPGYWKTHEEEWPLGYEPDGSGNLSEIQEEKQKRLKERWPEKSNGGSGDGTYFNDVFPNARATLGLYYDLTLTQAFAFDDKDHEGAVPFAHAFAGHIVAGLFNTYRFGPAYGYSSMQQFIDKVELFFATNPTYEQQEGFKNDLVMLNERNG